MHKNITRSGDWAHVGKRSVPKNNYKKCANLGVVAISYVVYLPACT